MRSDTEKRHRKVHDKYDIGRHQKTMLNGLF
jgi:hypothetical protein